MSKPSDQLRSVPGTKGSSARPVAHGVLDDRPSHIGRYRVERLLGEGGFGIVYLAHDEKLQRPVAIKVPHRWLVSQLEDAEAYLAEARTVANLDHANIVPVYDVGSTDWFPCFVVSKYIAGSTLKTRANEARLPWQEAAQLVATVAQALHHAHKQGIVHRDIKPGNILLDKRGNPFVADFGLALREQAVGTGSPSAGTPAYMSPEQARGEGDRVDGRSDIFSLGVVFYELLTGRRPFQAESRAELLERICAGEPRPPRQIDDTVPRELDRICLKCLEKRPIDRYSAALDLAEDIRSWQEGAAGSAGSDGARDAGSAARLGPTKRASVKREVSTQFRVGKLGCLLRAFVLASVCLIAPGILLYVLVPHVWEDEVRLGIETPSSAPFSMSVQEIKEKVQIGLSAQEVQEVVGPPKQIKELDSSSGAQLWYYDAADGRVEVSMKDDKVIGLR
jgi:predicted Ser/Thr protein kinase